MPQTATRKNQQPPSAELRAKPLRGSDYSGTEDHVYGLVSVLYHALQGAETYEKYVGDAEKAGDGELVRFFEQCRDQQSERAGRAKQLLVARVDEATEMDDEEEDEE